MRRGMHAGRREEVHTILERVETEARGIGEKRIGPKRAASCGAVILRSGISRAGRVRGRG